MERCPNCRARRDGGETCRRCGMDLAPLLAVERGAESLLARAVVELAGAEVPAAIQTLTKARGLSADPFIGHLREFARTLPQGPQRPDRPVLLPEAARLAEVISGAGPTPI